MCKHAFENERIGRDTARWDVTKCQQRFTQRLVIINLTMMTFAYFPFNICDESPREEEQQPLTGASLTFVHTPAPAPLVIVSASFVNITSLPIFILTFWLYTDHPQAIPNAVVLTTPTKRWGAHMVAQVRHRRAWLPTAGSRRRQIGADRCFLENGISMST